MSKFSNWVFNRSVSSPITVYVTMVLLLVAMILVPAFIFTNYARNEYNTACEAKGGTPLERHPGKTGVILRLCISPDGRVLDTK